MRTVFSSPRQHTSLMRRSFPASPPPPVVREGCHPWGSGVPPPVRQVLPGGSAGLWRPIRGEVIAPSPQVHSSPLSAGPVSGRTPFPWRRRQDP